jgi:uncharacterized protein (TIGR00304 family)
LVFGEKKKLAVIEFLQSTGIVLIIIGVFIIILAILLISSKSAGKGRGRVRGGGVIMIGPVPIIFGTDRKSLKTVILLAIVLMVIVLIVIIAQYFLR